MKKAKHVKGGKGTTTKVNFEKLLGNIRSAGKSARQGMSQKSPYTAKRARGKK